MLIPMDRPIIDAGNIAAAVQQTAGSGFIIQHNNRLVVQLTSGLLDYTSDATTPIAAGTTDGQVLTVVNVSTGASNKTVTIRDSGNCFLNGDWQVGGLAGEGSALVVVWDNANSLWREAGRLCGDVAASGLVAHAQGDDTTASGDYSHAQGQGTTASGNYSHAQGQNTTASGYYAHAEGKTTLASGIASHAQGQDTESSGDYAHAEGKDTTASGDSAHAEGEYTTASGVRSHAEGYNSQAIGYYSHAEGNQTKSQGLASHAMGYQSFAKFQGEFAQSAGRFAANEYAQLSRNLLRAVTTDQSWQELFIDGTDERLVLEADHTYLCTVTVGARMSTGGSEGAMFKRSVVIDRTGNTTTLHNQQTIGTDYNPGSDYNIQITADDTNESLKIEVKHDDGVGSKSVRWLAVVEAVVVGY